MEEKLADYLTFVSTNLKGGMSFENSLWSAIRPEFGLLAEEMGLVSKKVMTGGDLIESLSDFAKKYPSPILRRSMNLITSEIESGGKITEIMDRVIEDLKKSKITKTRNGSINFNLCNFYFSNSHCHSSCPICIIFSIITSNGWIYGKICRIKHSKYGNINIWRKYY